MKKIIDEQQLKKYMRRKTIALIADIILILVISLIGIYVWKNIEYAKMMDGDPCRICEDKTGGKCIAENLIPTYEGSNLPTFNKTEADKLIP